jgi:hypothetical protein
MIIINLIINVSYSKYNNKKPNTPHSPPSSMDFFDDDFGLSDTPTPKPPLKPPLKSIFHYPENPNQINHQNNSII